jgi:hypothetical protein
LPLIAVISLIWAIKRFLPQKKAESWWEGQVQPPLEPYQLGFIATADLA